jgi:hypothetical protein
MIRLDGEKMARNQFLRACNHTNVLTYGNVFCYSDKNFYVYVNTKQIKKYIFALSVFFCYFKV